MKSCSSGIVDGAALVLIGSEQAGKNQNLTPRARIVATALVGSEPTIMLSGPAPAARKALAKAGLTVDDIDLFELNEAFASQVVYIRDHLNLPTEKLNINGGSIAIGHPFGMTGSRQVGHLARELKRKKIRYGVVTMCVGGGMGAAGLFESITY